MVPLVTLSIGALGLSVIFIGFAKVPIPSITAPMFSKSEPISHMIHLDMPLMRSAKLTAIAIAPTEIAESIQSQIDIALIEKTSR